MSGTYCAQPECNALERLRDASLAFARLLSQQCARVSYSYLKFGSPSTLHRVLYAIDRCDAFLGPLFPFLLEIILP